MPTRDPTRKSEAPRWAARIRRGDRAALEELFYAYYEDLCGFAEAQVGSPELAEDLVQDLFLDLWRRREALAIESSLRAYLFGAVRNLAAKHLERAHVRRRGPGDKARRRAASGAAGSGAPLAGVASPGEMGIGAIASGGAGPEETLFRRELAEALKASVAQLPERRQMVYRLSRQFGLTYEGIATVMEISPKTVESHMVAALKELRQALHRYRSATV